jgi:dTDP-4-dehydrorhamnose 3,5-epimerase
MQVIDTALPEVKLIEPRLFGDDRGFFFESWNHAVFAEHGLPHLFVQDNHSRSAKGVLRGIHYQLFRPQGKLVRVTAGAVWDVAVDLRRSSPRFGQWTGFELSAENRRMLWLPEGFGHGFVSLTDGTEFLYKCTAPYMPEHDRGVRWNDPDLAIDWPVDGLDVQLSGKDAAAPLLADAELYP